MDFVVSLFFPLAVLCIGLGRQPAAQIQALTYAYALAWVINSFNMDLFYSSLSLPMVPITSRSFNP